MHTHKVQNIQRKRTTQSDTFSNTWVTWETVPLSILFQLGKNKHFYEAYFKTWWEVMIEIDDRKQHELLAMEVGLFCENSHRS